MKRSEIRNFNYADGFCVKQTETVSFSIEVNEAYDAWGKE